VRNRKELLKYAMFKYIYKYSGELTFNNQSLTWQFNL